MVVRFLIKKALKVAFWISIFLASVFLSLQNQRIQNALINALVGDGIEVIISGSTGFFPFSFSFDRLQIKSSDKTKIPDIDIKNASILLSKKMTHVRNIKIGKMTVNSSNAQGFNFSDIHKFAQIICQKIVKRVKIDEMEFDGSKIRDISFSLDNALGLRVFNFVLNEKKYEAQVKIQNSNILLNLTGADFWANTIYGLRDQHLSLNYKPKLHEVFSFDGICSGNFASGIINLPEYGQKLSCQLSMENGKINARVFAKNVGIFVDLDFDISKEVFLINDAIFDNKIALKSFTFRVGDVIPKIQISVGGGIINVSDIDLFSETASIGRIEIKDIPLSEVPGLQAGNNGVLNGFGFYSNGVAEFTAKLNDCQLGEIKIPMIDISAIWRKDDISVTLQYDLLKKRSTINCNLVAEHWIPSSKSKINVKAVGEFGMRNYGLGGRQFADGLLKYQIDVSGTISRPIFAGNFELKDLAYMNPGSNTFIKGGAIRATIRNNCIVIDKIYATDDGTPRGTVTGAGKIVFNNGKLDTDVFVDFHDFNIIEFNEFYGKLNGKITAKGDILKSLKISGELYSENAKIDISRLIAKSSRAIEILEPKKKNEPKVQEKTTTIQWPIDIKFSFKNGLKMVSGFGIDSLWDGGVSISGDIADPKYDAKITMAKGSVKVSGKTFTLKHGEIWMNSSKPDIINVKVSAVKTMDNIKVGATFTQNEDGAKVTFFSKPYVSKVDVLSYLLFDKRSSEISTGEALTLFSMMGKLSNSGGFDIIDKLKSVFGIDALEIKKSTDAVLGERSSVSVGKSIGTMKISVEQGAGKDTTKIGLEKQITKRSKIMVDLSGKNSVGCGVGWSRRY
ncbi:MAG: translocation/assembly module TamB domain-containing protein [Holosporales bacterium]|nr:translocation/assembly module TamB domain-containing protein [Holosporales bacterium]